MQSSKVHHPGSRTPADAGAERGGSLALAGICLGFFAVLFDATAVTVATGDLAATMGASIVEMQWVINAYTVVFAAMMLGSGSLADRWGSRRVYLLGSAVFALASLACALAPNIPLLITARAVQGLGAAAIVPCSLALIAHRFAEGPARSRALGIWGGVSGVGLAAGPVLGGGLVAALGWRAVFIVVLPIAALSMLLVAKLVTETRKREAMRPDPGGQVLVVLGLVALIAALTQTSLLGWRHPLIWGLLGFAVLTGVGFVLLERRLSSPMLPPMLFANPRFSGATLVGLLFNFGLYGTLFALAVMLESSFGHSAAVTGLALLPLTAAVAGSAMVSGPLTACFGPRVPMLLGLSGGLLGALLLAVFGDGLPVAGIAALGAVLGLVGVTMPVMTGVALAAAGPRSSGLGAAALNAARQVGGALGVALLGSVLFQAGAGSEAPVATLRWPMALTAAGYLLALLITLATIGSGRRR